MHTRHATRMMLALTCLALSSLGAASCNDSNGTPSAGEGAISASVKDYEIALASVSATSGEVSFSIENQGPSTHEFVVIRSDTPPDQLPVESGLISEDGIDLVGEAEDIAPSTTAELILDLQPGAYVIMCNISGHYEKGMHTGFTVR